MSYLHILHPNEDKLPMLMKIIRPKLLLLLIFAVFLSDLPAFADCATGGDAVRDSVRSEVRRPRRIRVAASQFDDSIVRPVKLASHNSLTYAPELNGSPGVVARRNRCQSLDIEQQYALGVRLFDFRVRRGDDGEAVAAHGRIRYAADIEGALRFLDAKGGVTIRLMLENSFWPWRRTRDYEWFQEYAITLVARYTNIRFVCGRSKLGWDKVAANLPDEPEINQYIWRRRSTVNVIPKPARHARRQNKRNFVNLNGTVWSMFDFVELLYK